MSKENLGPVSRHTIQFGSGIAMGIAVNKYGFTVDDIGTFLQQTEVVLGLAGYVFSLVMYAFKKFKEKQNKTPGEDFENLN